MCSIVPLSYNAILTRRWQRMYICRGSRWLPSMIRSSQHGADCSDRNVSPNDAQFSNYKRNVLKDQPLLKGMNQ